MARKSSDAISEVIEEITEPIRIPKPSVKQLIDAAAEDAATAVDEDRLKQPLRRQLILAAIAAMVLPKEANLAEDVFVIVEGHAVEAHAETDPLAEEAGRNLDPFDLICHLVFDRPALTRRERADNVRKRDIFTKYGPQARAVLEALLQKYRLEPL